MARTLDPESYAIKRDAFVDAGSRLIATKGYEQLSIQELLSEVGASKGAFYHYFESKADLLQAVVERMADAVQVTWAEPMTRPGLTAVERLESVFALTAQWKNARRELVLAILDAWLSDHNAIVRDKFRQLVSRRMTPVLEAVVRQGVADGEFTTSDPATTAQVLVTLMQGTQEWAGEAFIARQEGRISLETVERSFRAYTEAFERIVGARPGSLHLISRDTLEIWFGPERGKEGP
jgi:AcrR family transcriptional regulator